MLYLTTLFSTSTIPLESGKTYHVCKVEKKTPNIQKFPNISND